MPRKKIDPRDATAEKIVIVLPHIQKLQPEGTTKAILTDLALDRPQAWYKELLECYVDFGNLERNDRRIAAMRAARILRVELPDECYDAN